MDTSPSASSATSSVATSTTTSSRASSRRSTVAASANSKRASGSGGGSGGGNGGSGGGGQRRRLTDPVLSAAYLDRGSPKKHEVVKRLRTVTEALSDDSVEPDSKSHPLLPSLTAALVSDSYLLHPDKEVRLHTTLACMEIFYLYAPEPPWDEGEILSVFHETVRQLANLSHCVGPAEANFGCYLRLLEQLDVVKIGVVLVELVRSQSPGHDDGSDEESTSSHSNDALEMLCTFLRTTLSCARVDHPPEVAAHAEGAVAACLEEFEGLSVPVPVLDELLGPIGAGPTVFVTNPAAVRAAAEVAAAKKRRNRKEAAAGKKGKKGKGKKSGKKKKKKK